MIKGVLSALMFILLSYNVFANDGSNDAKQQNIKQAKIVFEKVEHEYDTISLSGETRRTHRFSFTNKGEKNLYILHIATGCGCTTPKYSKKAVPPGEKGYIDIEFNAKQRPIGRYRKSITVYSNDPRSYTRIFVKGVISK